MKLQDNTKKSFGQKASNTEMPKETSEWKSIKNLSKTCFSLN